VTGGRRGAAITVAGAVLLGVGVAIAAQATGVHLTQVASDSMSPAIDRGDWIVTRDLSEHDRTAIGRRDIVLFRFPLGTAGRAVKRVVAIQGDNVAIGDRSVTVDGRVIPIAGAPSVNAARRRVEVVPEGHVFLLGDNAAVSVDSRSLGPVPQTEVVGRVLLVIPKVMLRLLLGAVAVIAVIGGGLFVARGRRRGAPRKRETGSG
jgi:signal peptidase I